MARGKSFIVDQTVRQDDDLLRFLANFSLRTRVFAEGNAVEFVDELHRRWVERHPDSSDEATPSAGDRGISRMEPGAVFLSYASNDLEAVKGIRDALDRAGVDVWFDKEALKSGDDFEAKIRSTIDDCSVFIPVISRQTLTPERRFFRIEWNYAQEIALKAAESQRFIVPVCIDDTPPESREVPERFRQLHWERLGVDHLRPEWVREVRDLYREYQRAVGGTR